MDLSAITKDMGAELTNSINYILDLNVSPQAKRELLRDLFLAVGEPFYYKMFADSSELFASTIKTLGPTGIAEQTSSLATKVVRNYALSRPIASLANDFFELLLGEAESEAFWNAKSLGKAPTLTRRLSGRENCKWCADRAGTFTNPTNDDFRRHRDCDCIFITKGFNSRNGVLKNYNKGKKEQK